MFVIAVISGNQTLQNLLVKRLGKQWRILREYVKMDVKVWTDVNCPQDWVSSETDDEPSGSM